MCVCTQCVHTCVCTCAFPPSSSLRRKHRCLARWKNTRPGYDRLRSCSANIHFPPPSHSGWSLQPLPTERLGHVTCFGHWNVSGCGLRRCLESVQAACLSSSVLVTCHRKSMPQGASSSACALKQGDGWSRLDLDLKPKKDPYLSQRRPADPGA